MGGGGGSKGSRSHEATWDGGSSPHHHKITLQPPASSLFPQTHAATTCPLYLGDTLQPVPSLSPVAHHEGTCRQRGGQREALCSGEDMAHLQQCPGERGGEVSGMPGSHGHCQCQALTCAPQSYCRNTYRGQLASVHSTSTNEVLRKLASTYTHFSLWIGANGSWKTCWEDQSPWNYANWATGQPQRLFKTCTVLSPKDGLWRSKACFKIRPFICEY
uniref:Bone marrow proteoglycan-like n=1 Tax=Coturnix japonica TaxID=93934 RepID=A0A8C2YF51_COTJA